jgi:hypothetical protein
VDNRITHKILQTRVKTTVRMQILLLESVQGYVETLLRLRRLHLKCNVRPRK